MQKQEASSWLKASDSSASKDYVSALCPLGGAADDRDNDGMR